MKKSLTIPLKFLGFIAAFVLCASPFLVSAQTDSSTSTPASSSASVPAPTAQTSIQTLSVDPKNDFVLEPAKEEVFVNPGDTAVEDLYITDRIPGQSTTFKVDVEDIEGTNDPNQPVLILDGEKGPYSGKDLIVPAVSEFTLSFGQQITIPVTITIPKDTEPGDLDSVVLVSNEPTVLSSSTSQSTEGLTRIISRIGSLYFIRVNGQANENGQLQDFRLNGPPQLFYDHGPFTFEILFNNTGNVHLVPYGTIDVYNIFGSQVTELPVDAYYSLPTSLRYRDVTWQTPFLFGRYTAVVNLNRGYGNITDTKTITFWVLPWQYILAVFGAIILLVLIITVFIRSFEIRRK